MSSNELFLFATSAEVKGQLKNDMDVLHGCLENELWKAAIIMIGSLIEAVLYYHIDNSDELKSAIPGFERRNVTLNDLLIWARDFHVIDNNLFRLTEPIRDYRNLIHPRVQHRLRTQINRNIVEIGYNVLMEIIHSTNRHFDTLIGQSAEATVKRIIESLLDRQATTADIAVYVPIIQKYGNTRGEIIIRRSIQQSVR